MRGRRGFTFTDAVFLMMLIVVVLIPIAGMFPLSLLSVQRGKTKSVALYLAKQDVNQVRSQFPATLTNHVDSPLVTTTTVTMQGSDYQIIRKVWTVETREWVYLGKITRECDLVDVEVTVVPPMGPPFVYSTRLCEDTAMMGVK